MTGAGLLQTLQSQGVTHLVGLPDNTSGPVLQLADGNDCPRHVAVTREGEAFAVAAGLWIGGAMPAVLIQNTGLLESGDAIRGTVARMRVPLLCLVTFRGYSTLRGAKRSYSPDDLSDSSIDSAALLTEPTLRAWGIPYRRLGRCGAEQLLGELLAAARQASFPAVALMTALESGSE